MNKRNNSVNTEQAANITEKRLILKDVLCEMPFETNDLKRELYTKGFKEETMSRIWRGIQKDIKLPDALIIVAYIQEKGRQLFIADGHQNKWQSFEISDLYKFQSISSSLGKRLVK